MRQGQKAYVFCVALHVRVCEHAGMIKKEIPSQHQPQGLGGCSCSFKPNLDQSLLNNLLFSNNEAWLMMAHEKYTY
jgi:hypothetical protein